MKRILSLCFSALLLVACTSEEIPFEYSSDTDESSRIRLSISDMDDRPMTYSAATYGENLIRSGYIFVFNAAGTQLHSQRIDTSKIIGNGSASPIMPQLVKDGKVYTIPTGSKVYVICNPTHDVNNGQFTNAFTDTELAAITEADILAPNVPFGNNKFLSSPMGEETSTCTMAGKIDGYSAGAICVLTRTWAKVTVRLGDRYSDKTGGFNTETVKWGTFNDTHNKWLFLQSSGPDGRTSGTYNLSLTRFKLYLQQNEGNNRFYWFLDEYRSSTVDIEGNTILKNQFSPKRPYIMLQKVFNNDTTYYRLDYYDQAKGEFLDIVRNTHYIFTINKVMSEGYRSRQEALANPASNIEYTVTAQTNDNVIESNGQYAIALTNNECHIFGDIGTYEIAQGRYILPTEMTSWIGATTNTITTSGTGLTLNSPTSLTQAMQPISVTLTDAFTEGYVALQLGNIRDTIQVTRTNYNGVAVTKTIAGNVISDKLDGTGITYTKGSGDYTVNIPALVTRSEGMLYTSGQNNGNKKIIVQGCSHYYEYGKGKSVAKTVRMWDGSTIYWSSVNLGATKPWEYGDYYAWSAVEPWLWSYDQNGATAIITATATHSCLWKGSGTTPNEPGVTRNYNSYKWTNAPYNISGAADTWTGNVWTKYTNSNASYSASGANASDLAKTRLDLADDAARYQWGGNWRMPTQTEFQDLIDNCYFVWSANYKGTGIPGYIVYNVGSQTSLKGQQCYSGGTPASGYSNTDPDTKTHIFFPVAGGASHTSINRSGIQSDYWSSSLSTTFPHNAYMLHLENNTCFAYGYYYRSPGYPIRPVWSE